MKKFKFQLDTESINRENELHSNNFPLKVKNLAEHCINFINGLHNIYDCSDRRFNREIHDSNIIQMPIEVRYTDEISPEKNNTYKKKCRELEFKERREKFLL